MNRQEPEWVAHAVFWHVYPLGFTGAPLQRPPAAEIENERGQHRLARLQNWLDYAVELGASALMLAPVFESSSHGYDTLDYFHVDARLGDDRDLAELLDAAHDRGLRVVLDGVFNHVGRGFPHQSWYRYQGDDVEVFEGHSGLAVLDHERPEVVRFVIDVMTHWLDRGADGWRLDAAYAVPPEFWARVLPAVREKHPDAYIFGEVIHGDYAGIVATGGLDAVTQYELWKAIWSSIDDRNLFELAHALERHNGYLDTFVPLTFAGNHDVTRIASRIGETRHLAHALVVLFTIGGTPAVYYGDEQAFRGIKEDRAGGDDAIRPAFPGGPDDLSALGWPTYRLHQDLIGLRRRHPWLHRARTTKLDLQNHWFTYTVADGGNSLAVVLNLDENPLQATVPGGAGQILLAGDGGAELTGTTVDVPAHGWAVLGSA